MTAHTVRWNDFTKCFSRILLQELYNCLLFMIKKFVQQQNYAHIHFLYYKWDYKTITR